MELSISNDMKGRIDIKWSVLINVMQANGNDLSHFKAISQCYYLLREKRFPLYFCLNAIFSERNSFLRMFDVNGKHI